MEAAAAVDELDNEEQELEEAEARDNHFDTFTGGDLDIVVAYVPNANMRKQVELTVENAVPGWKIMLLTSKADNDDDEDEEADYSTTWKHLQSFPIPKKHDSSKPFTFALDESFLQNQINGSERLRFKRLAAVLVDPKMPLKFDGRQQIAMAYSDSVVYYTGGADGAEHIIDWASLAAEPVSGTVKLGGKKLFDDSEDDSDFVDEEVDDDEDDDDDGDLDGDSGDEEDEGEEGKKGNGLAPEKHRRSSHTATIQKWIIGPFKDELHGYKKKNKDDPKAAVVADMDDGKKFNDVITKQGRGKHQVDGSDGVLAVGFVQLLAGDRRKGSMFKYPYTVPPNGKVSKATKNAIPFTGWLAVFEPELSGALDTYEAYARANPGFAQAVQAIKTDEVMDYHLHIDDPADPDGGKIDNPGIPRCWALLDQ